MTLQLIDDTVSFCYIISYEAMADNGDLFAAHHRLREVLTLNLWKVHVRKGVSMVSPCFYLGVDVGSLSCDAAIVDSEGRIVASAVLPTGVSGQLTADRIRDQLFLEHGLTAEDMAYTIATGYGRERVKYADKSVTEITCHGRGAHAYFPATTVIIDIGGQDSKAIRIDVKGKVADFVMNDRCAAGTGRFLEVMARALEIDLLDMGQRSREASTSCQISSICTVFAESEVVSLLANGTPSDHIIRGIHDAVARRTIGLLQRIKPTAADSVTLSGGVALNKGVVAALEELLKKKVSIPENPQIVGAVGAALIARDTAMKNHKR